MQPCSGELQAINSLLNQQPSQMMPFDTTSLSSRDDFFEQIISSLNNPSSSSSCASWPDLSNPNPNLNLDAALKTALVGGGGDDEAAENGVVRQYRFEEEEDQSSEFLSSKLRHQQINSGESSVSPSAATRALMLYQHLMLSGGLAGNGLSSPTGTVAADGHSLLPMPLGLGDDDQNDVVDGSSFKSANPANDGAVQALFSGFSAPLGQTTNPPQQFHHLQGGVMQGQNFGGGAATVNQAAPPSGSTGPGASAQPKQQRVRARRGQATDPHSIAERLRRERIAERMKSLQELVPNANKTDKASMLDEIIEYVKFLQLQVKVLSMSRLGGAAAVAPLVADMASPAGRDRGRSNGTQTASPSNNEGVTTMTEQQVAKLMEEDMGSAMQYLQGKGLCLMPISLATAISTATCHSGNTVNPLLGPNGTSGPASPTGSVLTVANAVGEASVSKS